MRNEESAIIVSRAGNVGDCWQRVVPEFVRVVHYDSLYEIEQLSSWMQARFTAATLYEAGINKLEGNRMHAPGQGQTPSPPQ